MRMDGRLRLSYKKRVGTVGSDIPTSAACCLYYSLKHRALPKNEWTPTFNPIHRIAPASFCVKGLSTLPIESVLPVALPGSSADAPEKTLTLTSWPIYRARPTSTFSSCGSPTRTFEESDSGTKRTRPRPSQKLIHPKLRSIDPTFKGRRHGGAKPIENVSRLSYCGSY